MHTLRSNKLEATVDLLGAELRMVKDLCTGYEFMWQADPLVWARTAPLLFPFVGRCTANIFSYEGREYPVKQHGFARDLPFALESSTADSAVFLLSSGPGTLGIFPFHFELRLSYRLEGNQLSCGYEVLAPHNELFFSIGAHPGFRLPSGRMSDYELDFGGPLNAVRHLLTEGLLDGRTEKIETRNGCLSLSPALFEKDAIVLKNSVPKSVTLRAKSGDFSIRMDWKDFPYLGIWSKPGSEAFLCIEPWCGVTGSKGSGSGLEQKEGINRLERGGVFRREYHIYFSV